MKTEQETETNTPPPTNGETAAVEESRRVRPKWLVPLVAGLCALALVVAGGIGWKIWSDRRLAEAKAACATASDAARGAMNDWNTLVNGDAADLLEVKADQVKDAKTIDALKTALDVEAPEYEGCVAENAQGLDAAAVKLNEQADWYETHEKSLSKAVRAVVESKAAKRLDDAKTNLTAKLDEASKLLAERERPGKDGRGCASRRSGSSGSPGSGAGPIHLQRRLLLLRRRVRAHGRLHFRLQHIPWHHIGRLRPGRRLRPKAEPQRRLRLRQQLHRQG